MLGVQEFSSSGVGFAFVRRDSANQTSLLALAAPSVQTNVLYAGFRLQNYCLNS